jgi:CRISPR/Cas system-associated exonuclease Cas4 (RecB family)
MSQRLRTVVGMQGTREDAVRPRWHSQSSCSDYERCPRRYWHAYVDRTPTEVRAPQHWRFGTVVHAGLEAAFRAVQGTDRRASEAVEEALAGLRDSWVEEAMPAGELARAEQLVRRSVTAQDLTGRQILGVEEWFRDRTPFGHRLAGAADLVLEPRPGVLEIRDHKVTRSHRTPRQLLVDRQLNLYAWMAKRQWPWATAVYASHHYPQRGEVVRVRLRPAHTAAIIDALASRVTADVEYLPTPGSHCGHCRWAPLCPAAAG